MFLPSISKIDPWASLLVSKTNKIYKKLTKTSNASQGDLIFEIPETVQ